MSPKEEGVAQPFHPHLGSEDGKGYVATSDFVRPFATLKKAGV